MYIFNKRYYKCNYKLFVYKVIIKYFLTFVMREFNVHLNQ